MNKLRLLISNLVKDESGQDLIEYALVASIVGLGAVATLQPLATEIGTVFSSITTSLKTAVTGASGA